MVDAAIAPVIGVIICGDCDVDGGKVLHVHGVEGVDELLSLVGGIAVFYVLGAGMGFGDLAAVEAGGGSAVEVVRVEGLGTVIRVVVESIFIEAAPVYCDPRSSETLLHATECYEAIGSYGHHQQAEHQGFYACHYLISNIIIIG